MITKTEHKEQPTHKSQSISGNSIHLMQDGDIWVADIEVVTDYECFIPYKLRAPSLNSIWNDTHSWEEVHEILVELDI